MKSSAEHRPAVGAASALASLMVVLQIAWAGPAMTASLWAALIAVSTLYTKQHYVVDVFAGALAAYGAYMMFLRRHPRDKASEAERRLAPRRALAAIALFGIMVAAFWAAYRLGFLTHPVA